MEKSYFKLYIRLVKEFLLPYWKAIVTALVCMFCISGLNVIPALSVKFLIDDIIPDKDLTLLGLLAGALVVAYTLRAITEFGQDYLAHRVAELVMFDLRVQVYGHIQKLSSNFFRNRRTGEIMSRIINDIDSLRDMLAHSGDAIVTQSLNVLVVAAVLFTLQWKLALFTLIPIPLTIILVLYFNKAVRQVYQNVREKLADVNARLLDNLSGIEVIKSFVMERRELNRFAAESKDYFNENMVAIKLWAYIFPTMIFVVGIGSVIVIWYGGGQVISGELTVGSLVAFSALAWRLYWPLMDLGRENEKIQKAMAAVKRIFELLDTEPEIKDSPSAVELTHPRLNLSGVKGEIEFRGVSFAYDRDCVLKNIHLKIEPGEIIALVGPSGVGKTTLAGLIPRFYDPDEGTVSIYGIDIKGIKLESLRSNIGIVHQETFLFNGTIAENVGYGKISASLDEVVEAAKAANIYDFVSELPDGFDTVVGERGVKLSGGQKQRIAIARAILKDPPILILDEATSSVDTESEQLIQQSLSLLLKDRMTLIIAHRLATIKSAHRIVVLKDGEIEEIGSHFELIENGGAYRRLYEAQFGSREVVE